MDKLTDPKQQSITKAQESVLQLPGNKRDINRISGGIISGILEGDKSALEIDVKLRYLELLIKTVRSNEQVKGLILEEAEKYPEKTYTEYGVEISKAELGTSYDYSNCSDSTYVELQNDIADLTAAKKRRETFLKSLDGEGVNPDTGEVIYPPVKKSTSGVKIKLL